MEPFPAGRRDKRSWWLPGWAPTLPRETREPFFIGCATCGLRGAGALRSTGAAGRRVGLMFGGVTVIAAVSDHLLRRTRRIEPDARFDRGGHVCGS